jgi:hypothetical protein
VIPRDDMTDIYYDMYMSDRYFEAIGQEELGDSVNIYIPIIESHGYTYEKYLSTLEYYHHKPEEFTKIFKNIEKRLTARKEHLTDIVERERQIQKKWKLLDSLHIYGDTAIVGNGHFRALRLLFFKTDTMEVTSPTIDSVILNHITSPYFLYDSLPGLYDRVDFVMNRKTPGDTIKAKSTLQKIKLETQALITDGDQEEQERSTNRINRFSKAKFNDNKKDFR